MLKTSHVVPVHAWRQDRGIARTGLYTLTIMKDLIEVIDFVGVFASGRIVVCVLGVASTTDHH
jgi:hypothetical protein